MEFNIKNWLDEISTKIKNHFGKRVLFIGYHGSYKRGEATAHSDIDMVIILDKLSLDDLKKYKNIVKSMPYSEKACGFICAKKEIQNWSKSDMFQFIFETEALFGSLEDLITPLSKNDIKQAVKSGAQTLYHSACHSFLFDDDLAKSLAVLYKMTFFILQADYYLKSNKYIATKKELIELLKGSDKKILQTCLDKDHIKNFDEEKIDELYEDLITWCANKI